MLYLDSSALAKLYVAEPETVALAREVSSQSEPIPYTPLHELELAGAIQRRLAAGDLTQAAGNRILRVIEGDLGSGVLFRAELGWAEALAAAIVLVKRHGVACGLRSLDALHLASARLLEAEVLISYDSRQIAAARAESMSVLEPR